jgi:cytochrome o ubiquinol oxidase subunit IV
VSHDTHHHDDHGHHEIEMPHATMRDYVIGFILAVILTVIPFWLVMNRPLETGPTVAIIAIFAVVQVVVHMVYFLHMSPKSEGGWTFTTLVFTLIVVVIMLAGSLWVMSHLHSNMMPMAHDATEPAAIGQVI